MQNHIKQAVTEDAVRALCGEFGLKADKIKLLGDAQNLVFAVNPDYVLKFIHSSHRNLEQLNAEAEFIRHLELAGLGVQHHPKARGESYIRYENAGQSFWVGAETRARGIRPSRNDPAVYNEKLIELWGKTTALMHRAAESFVPQTPRFMFIDDPSIAGAEELLREHCGDKYARDYHDTLARILALPMDKSAYGTVHYDLHYGNFYVDGERLSMFDFDDCCLAHYISDIAVALFAHCKTDPTMPEEYARETGEFMESFMRGYERERHMDELFMSRFESFMRYRRYLIVLFYITDYEPDDPEAVEGKAAVLGDLNVGLD